MSAKAHKKNVFIMATGKNRKPAQDFAAAFFASTPPEDLAGWTAEDMSAVAASMYALGQGHKGGSGRVRVFNPDAGAREDGHIPPTVVEVVGDDMPFVIDSVSAELAHRGLHIDTLFHPILNVVRDAKGAITAVSGGPARGPGHASESYAFIRLEQLLPKEACDELAACLMRILGDVHRATADWQAMVKKMDALTRALPKGEGRELLAYLRANNFTFLGHREYRFAKGAAKAAGPGLGVLRGEDDPVYHEGYEAVLAKSNGPVMVSKMVDRYSTVHRRVPMDAISVKIFDRNGKLSGMHMFVGLFTSSTYSCRTVDVPVVREKVRATIARAGFRHGSHDHRALEHILEKMPRDELFQVRADDLYALALGILRLQDKHRIALFTHKDPLQKYMSCLVYVPRDRYNTTFRMQAGRILEEAMGGRLMNYFTTLDDSPLARVLFMIRLPDGQGKSRPARFDPAAAEHRLADLGREWDEKLRHVLVAAYGKTKGVDLTAVYGRAFTAAYHESIDIGNVLHDIRQIEALEKNGEQIRIELYRLAAMPPGRARLKVYNRGAPVPLSQIMPVLENMGLAGISEMPYEAKPAGRGTVWIHDFLLEGTERIELAKVKKNFEEAFLQVWQGSVENDSINRLVMVANLTWREALVFRACSAYLRQARFPYSGPYMAQVLGEYPHIVRGLLDLFFALHDPKGRGKGGGAKAIAQKIDGMIQAVEKIDHDRILRLFRQLIEKTLRTNYFQQGKDCLSFKLDSSNIDGLPLPKPHVEIFVYSPRVEAVHLRNGAIARGGIRWSDRPDDFRTEVLGLMKAQTVKNTVIVPTGAKGGFVLKQPPKTGGRDALKQEGIACYKIFVQALLDLTDNNVKGRIVRPKDVLCHDGPDPYLVVAADKGTATFSDIANELSLKAGFWLADAFASGGSAGYDHKEVGITARGGWESVKRHFSERGKDIQKEAFTVAGVGDMGGDVFGNAMLLSKKIRLVGAFNHLHIFCDPEPDPAASFAERSRLFHGVLGWDAYDRSKLSPGGAVFDRTLKTLRLSPQIRKRFGIAHEQTTPDELIRAILKADVELLWFGGIGTFVKSSHQNHADADDKSNDSVRVDANELRAKVIGEGANLGVTQLGRVEYARHGGGINTDFIDNSGGVDCSDHEVNIKILLSPVTARGRLPLPQRNKLLERMTDDVAKLVLNDNYQQNLSLTLQLHAAREMVGVHGALIRALEKSGLIKRGLEGLPDEERLARMAREGFGLVRPELCVLMSWSKIALYREVVASSIPDDPSLEWMLFGYFPAALHKYGAEIRSHRLRREIISSQVVNILVNRMGAAFVHSRMEKTGADAESVIRAFLIAMEAFGLQKLWNEVEALDGKVAGAVQIAALHEIYQVCKRAVTWLLRFEPSHADIGREIAAFRPGIESLRKNIQRYLPPESAADLSETGAALEAKGMPAPLAAELSVTQLLSSACDIITIAKRTRAQTGAVASAYFLAGQRLSVDWLKARAAAVRPVNSWQGRVIGSLLDDYYVHQAAITAQVVKSPRWFEKNAVAIARFAHTVAEMKAQPQVDLDMLVLAGQRLGQIAAGTG